jgi:DNA primase
MSNVFDIVTEYCIEQRNEAFNDYVFTNRLWSKETIDSWQIGFFPSKQLLSLKIKIKDKKLSIDELEDLHVLSNYGVKGYSSKFYDRIIFPIKDEFGNTISITGRTIIKGVEPKYYNTEFEKGKILYGLDRAIRKIRETGIAYVCEGNADVVTAHQNGVTNTVGFMGTAFRKSHIRKLAAYADTIILIFDNDTGGKNALGAFNEKRIDSGFKGVNVRIGTFNGYRGGFFKDVDDFIKAKGAGEFVRLMKEISENQDLQRKLRLVKKDKKDKGR